MHKSQTKRALLTSVLALVLCVAMFASSTYAWFTDTASTGINKIISGNLDVKLEYSKDCSTWADAEKATNIFSANKWEPGYTEVVYFKVTNAGSLAFKYYVTTKIEAETAGLNQKGESFKLSDYLQFGTVETTKAFADRDTARAAITAPSKFGEIQTAEASLTAEENANSATFAMVVWMPEETGNAANHNGEDIPEINFGVNVVATQKDSESDSYNNQYDKDALYPDEWDGTIDTAWYEDKADEIAAATSENPVTVELNSATEFAGLSEIVADGNNLENVIIKLDTSVDMSTADEPFYPIGYNSSTDATKYFKGEFDGQGNTISGVSVNGLEMASSPDYIGVFAAVSNATVKNLVVDTTDSVAQSNCVGGVTAYAAGDCTFEDITIVNSTVSTYNNSCAAVVAYASNGAELTFKNITIDNTVTVAALWNNFDFPSSAILGRVGSNVTVSFENCHISAKFDVYNDVMSSYHYWQYRYAGAFIGYVSGTKSVDGRTIPDLSNVTMKNCSVDFGDWNDYYYCNIHDSGKEAMRVDKSEIRFDTDGITILGCVHSEHNGEAAFIPFRNLFGGATGVSAINTDNIATYYPEIANNLTIK